MKKDLLINFLLFFIFGCLLFVFFIPYLRKIKFGQNIREDGPQRHLLKKGTPTLGGCVIFVCTLIFFSFFLIEYKEMYKLNFKKCLFLWLPVLLFSLIGFIDDFLIVIKKKNEGLSPKLKFILQLLFAASTYYLFLYLGYDNKINFFGIFVDIKFLYGIVIIFLLVGVSNATNLTDGLDGLLAGCSIISYTSFGIIGICKQNYEVVFFSIAMSIALLCFLIFNLPKAKLFMGNVGSILIGTGLVMESILLNMELNLLFIGFVYFLETISVILQVWFFKKTKGKRLFLMSPLHHHLELADMSEVEIDITFYFLSLVTNMIGIYLGVNIF